MKYPTPEARRIISERYYERNPDRFLGPPSRFCAWALDHLGTLPPPVRLIELGCGPGRDSRGLAAAGLEVRAVDHSALAIQRAQRQPGSPPGLRFECATALEALRTSPSGSCDAVYSHALLMLVPDPEISELATEVRRVLRSGGLHLFAVRSTSDPIARTSREVAPDIFVRDPEDEPIRYYRESTLDRWTREGFARVAAEHAPDLHLWYVCDRRT